MKFLLLVFIAFSLSCSKEDTPDEQTGNNSSLVYTISEKFSAEKEADRLEQWLWASDFEAVGLYQPSGKTIEIDLLKLRQ